MKLLYIIGSGSLYNNEELRYSIRTVEKHLKDVDEVIVVGEKVDFLSDKVKYHYIKEAFGNKEYRIAMKIYTACKLGYVSGDFALMNDDFFFTRQFDWKQNFAKENLESKGSAYYQAAINETRNYLKRLGHTTYHFDMHTPIVYNSERFMSMLPHFEASKRTPYGMVVKSLYGNINGLKPTFYKDCKLNQLLTLRDFEKIKNTPVISCSNFAWNKNVKAYFNFLYPNKSKYER